MRIRVTHETTFAFTGPARALHLALRMTPRSFESQYVLRWRVSANIDASLRPSEDAFGSVVHALSWHKPVERLTASAVGEVETNDAVGVVRGAVETSPPTMFLRASPLAQANAAMRRFAEAAGQGASDPLDRLHRLMEALHKEIAYAPGFGGEAPASEIFALRKGGAADFAHVFVACARLAEIPARVVTGYRVAEADEEGTEMFAWVEALSPGLGWVAFDAVHNLCANDAYVRVAVGLDAKDAAPFRIWHNAGESAVTARLRVEQAAAQGQN
jgi:transglutaminase-like putative cysteine protease